MKEVTITRHALYVEPGYGGALHLGDDEEIVGVEIRNSRVIEVITVEPDIPSE